MRTPQGYENELFDLRMLVLQLMPPDIQKAIDPWIEATSSTEWKLQAVEKVIGLAEPNLSEETNPNCYGGERVCCPLCGKGHNDSYGGGNEGFAYPNGLRRHLLGSGGAHPCGVFRAASGLIRIASNAN